MSEAVSAMQGARADGAVTIEEAGLRGMITLRGDLSDPGLQAAATGISGTAFPGQREICREGARGLAWMSPDEVLILLPYDEAEAATASLSEALGGAHHLAANVSDARAVFRISGAGAREVLAKGAPVDLAPGRFEHGEIRRTRLGQIAAAFWMTDAQSFELVCFRSVAGFVFDWLEIAAKDGALPEYF